MFLVNSRSPHFTATRLSSNMKILSPDGHTFSRSYGAILPSSLTRVLSSALVYSTCLPVSVYGTVTSMNVYEDFPGSMESTTLQPLRASSSRLNVNENPDLPGSSAFTLKPGFPTPGWPILLRPPLYNLHTSGTGILTCFPSTTLFSLALGAD